jgi:hypothetical protein
MSSLANRIEKLEVPSLYGVPLIVDAWGCKSVNEAKEKYKKEHGMNPDEYRGGKVLYIIDGF